VSGKAQTSLAPISPKGRSRPFLARLLVLGVLVAGVLSGMISGMTSASYQTQSQSSSNGFTVGSVVVGVGLDGGDTLTASNIVPGDSFVARLAIQSSGTLGLRYAMTTGTNGDASLADAILLTIRTKTINPCSIQDGSILYGPGSMRIAFLGDPANGFQAGDRSLDSGATEDLCFLVTMPPDTPISLQGKSATVTLYFSAEQQ
jgi:hypothetical protein